MTMHWERTPADKLEADEKIIMARVEGANYPGTTRRLLLMNIAIQRAAQLVAEIERQEMQQHDSRDDVLMHSDLLPWQKAQGEPFSVAAKWGGTPSALAAFLGCAEETAIQMGFCRAPEPGEELEAWAARVAEQCRGVWVKRVRYLAEVLAKA